MFRWNETSHMKASLEKPHVLESSNIQQVVLFGNVRIISSLCKKMLGITFDSELKF